MISTHKDSAPGSPGQVTRRCRAANRTGDSLLALVLWATSVAVAAAGSAADHSNLVALARPDIAAREDAAIGSAPTRDRAVLGAVERWRSAWERRDTGAYLATYVEGVSPIQSMPAGEWRQRRSHQLSGARNLSIRLSDLQIVALDSNVAKVRFQQSYQAKNFQDRLWKVLKLMRTREGWRIRHEEVLPARPES